MHNPHAAPYSTFASGVQDWASLHGISLARPTLPAPGTTVRAAPVEAGPCILQGHEEIVWAVEVHGRRLFSASADKTIRVWNIDSRRCEYVLEDHARPVLSLATSNGKLYSGSYDFTIKVWNLETLQRVRTLSGHTDAVRALCVADGRIFSGSYDGTVRHSTLLSCTCCVGSTSADYPVRVECQ